MENFIFLCSSRDITAWAKTAQSTIKEILSVDTRRRFNIDRTSCDIIRRRKCSAKPQPCNFIKKKSLAQVFSCEFCEISKNTFFHRTPLVAASAFQTFDKMNNLDQKCCHMTLSESKN